MAAPRAFCARNTETFPLPPSATATGLAGNNMPFPKSPCRLRGRAEQNGMLMTDILFTDVERPVRFLHCPMLLGQARRFFHAWPHEEARLPEGDAVIHVRAFGREPGGYDIRAPWMPGPCHEPSMASALCSLAIELVAAFCESHPQMTCLHAAAVRSGNGTLLLLGDNHAGKSTLVARLMAEGRVCLGDDLIGVAPGGTLWSFGIPPRLRLPLPSSPGLAAFVQKNRGIRDDRYQYLRADCAFSAPFGQALPPDRIIILQRRSGERARLLPVTHDSGLMQLLPHYVMRRGSADIVLGQAAHLIRNVPAFVFRYSGLDEAADVLLNRPSTDAVAPEAPHHPRPHESSPAMYARETPRLSRTCHRQAPGTRIRVEHGNIFLMDGASDRMYGLNRLGETLWHMLEQPLSEAEAAQLLQEAFPGTDKGRIAHDVAEIFARLRHEGLILRCTPETPPRAEKNRN